MYIKAIMLIYWDLVKHMYIYIKVGGIRGPIVWALL